MRVFLGENYGSGVPGLQGSGVPKGGRGYEGSALVLGSGFRGLGFRGSGFKVKGSRV